MGVVHAQIAEAHLSYFFELLLARLDLDVLGRREDHGLALSLIFRRGGGRRARLALGGAREARRRGPREIHGRALLLG